MPAPQQISETYTFGDYKVVVEDGTLLHRGIRVRLQDQPFRLLILLIRRAGNVVSAREIQDHLWSADTNVEFDKSLRVAISKLREALRDQSESPTFVETVPRRGYRFLAKVTAVAPPPISIEPFAAPAGSQIETVLATPASAPQRAPLATGRPFLGGIAFWLLGAGIIFAFAGIYVTHRILHHAEPASVSARPQARRSIVVLRLRNLDGRSEDMWLSTALAEMLSTELAGSEKLRVISGEQVARAGLGEPLANSPSHETMVRMGSQLGADLIVTGTYTVSPSADKNSPTHLRIDLRMEDLSSDGPPCILVETGLTSGVSDVVSTTGSRLRQRLGVDDTSVDTLTAVRRTLPSNPTAAQFYAEGLDRLRANDALQARDLLGHAAKIEPTHASTQLALSDAWHVLGYDAEARTAATRAVELSTGLPREESLSMQAQSAIMSHDWQHAIDILRTLATFYPDNIDYGIRLARTQVSAGKTPDALLTLAEVKRQSPSRADDARVELAEAYALLHHNEFPQALATAQHAVQIGTELDQKLVRAEGLWMAAESLERMGKAQESLNASREAQTLYRAGGDKRGLAVAMLLSGDVLFDQGKIDEARKEFLPALDIFKAIGFLINVGVTQERLGNCYFAEGKLAESRDLYQQSLDAYRAAKWELGIPSAIGNIANVLDQEGDIERSLRLNAEGLAEFEQTGQQRGYADTLANMGHLEMERGGAAAASVHYARAAEIDTKINYAHGLAQGHIDEGEVAFLHNNPAEAISHYRQALKAMQDMDEPSILSSAHIALGSATLLAGHTQESIPQLQQGIDYALKNHAHDIAAEGYAWLTRSLLVQGKIADASAAAAKADDEAHKQFGPRPILIASLAVARVEIAQGKLSQARDVLHAALQTALRHHYDPLALEARILLAQTEAPSDRQRQLKALSAEATLHDWKTIAVYARVGSP